MIGLFVALAIEWVAVARLRRAMTYEQAREWAVLTRLSSQSLSFEKAVVTTLSISGF
jgi:hypothetical protein